MHTEGQAAPKIANIEGGARPGFVPLNRNGFIGGSGSGTIYQFGQFVAGIETDIDYTDFRDNRSVTTAQLVTGLPLNNTFSSRLNFLGTVRDRLGLAYDHSLFHATGGLAYGETKQHIDMFGPTCALRLIATTRYDGLRPPATIDRDHPFRAIATSLWTGMTGAVG
jgi:outer membrane immunogenic protein